MPLALSVARLGTYMDRQWVTCVRQKTKRNRSYLRPLTTLSFTHLVDTTQLAYLSIIIIIICIQPQVSLY